MKRLSQILEVAKEYEYIPRNPARGKRRRVKAPKVPRSWVEPEQALALIEAGSTYMRPMIATLVGAGLRVSEAVALEWSDVNLATGTIRVGKAKTDAGSYREVGLPGGLVDELAEWRMRGAGQLARWIERNPGMGEPVFLSRHAGNVRRQSAANVARAAQDRDPQGKPPARGARDRAGLRARHPALVAEDVREPTGGVR